MTKAEAMEQLIKLMRDGSTYRAEDTSSPHELNYRSVLWDEDYADEGYLTIYVDNEPFVLQITHK